MILVDLFSQFIKLVPLKDQVANTICQAVLEGWIFKHGPPRIMLSDQGPNVDGTEERELLRSFGVEKRHSTLYHPEGDGQAERGAYCKTGNAMHVRGQEFRKDRMVINSTRDFL